METRSGHPFQRRTRVLIVEDQASLREMLADVLTHKADFEVVGQAADLEEAMRLATATEPDVIVLDWLFPGGGGLEFLQAMRRNRLQSQVLVLSGNTTEESVRLALMSGAKGFFEKGAELEEFILALRTIAAGGAYFGPAVARIVQHLVGRTAPSGGAATGNAPAPAAAEPATTAAGAEPASSPAATS